MEPYRLYWIEEPVATDDIRGSAEVARALGTAIAGYETEVGLYGFRELIAQRAVDIIQPDIAWAGGFGLSLIAIAMLKIWYWMELNKNAVTREVKRVELQLARLARQLKKAE